MIEMALFYVVKGCMVEKYFSFAGWGKARHPNRWTTTDFN